MNEKTLEDYKYEKTTILDTCYIIYELEKQKEKELLNFCENNKTILISFTEQELIHVTKKLKIKKKIKDFLNKAKLIKIKIPVEPGEYEKEREYVNNYDEKLLQKIKDPSDAVLAVSALKSNSNILTRDKHHLFTETLENEFNKYNLQIINDMNKC